ncbi:hypothetical protein VYA_33240 [Vibrio alfacsensis]|nr:hypothetical protein VA249_33790 [Vibrio alfacsensis]BCN26132.1 hypothetical protein VYA_33240 [Vibrio alfacsensis]
MKIVGELADDSHTAIIYPAAIVKDSTESKQLFEYLQSSDAQQVFAQYGFE